MIEFILNGEIRGEVQRVSRDDSLKVVADGKCERKERKKKYLDYSGW